MPQHRLTARAEADLNEIWEHIAEDSPRNAGRVIDSIVDRFPLLAEQRFMGRARPEFGPELRSFPVGSYVIVYRPTDYGVEIVRVVHGRRDIAALF